MTPIQQAREFVLENAFNPVLASDRIDEKTRNVTRSGKRWIERFPRVGDLWIYLSRFQTPGNNQIYKTLKSLNLPTYEDIVDEFRQRFASRLDDVTNLDDFIVGRSYSAFEILIPARVYDTRVGGIMPIGTSDQIDAIVIKATLQGGKYANAWLESGKALKYYFKSIKDTFKASYRENKAILENRQAPIYTFVRDTPDDEFIYNGVFYYQEHHTEEDGSMWFKLVRTFEDATVPVVDSSYLQDELDENVAQSRQQTQAQRQARLKLAPKTPKKIQIVSAGYERNSDVIAEILTRANGICEDCQQPAPFNRRKDGTPYLEVHHRIPLAENGEDTVENAAAFCPNCHRKAHYG